MTWNLTNDVNKYVSTDASNGLQVGSGNYPETEIHLTSSNRIGTIKKVIVNARGGLSGVACSVKVGSTNFTNGSSTSKNMTTSFADYEFVGSGEGAIDIMLSKDGNTKAVYIKKITVYYIQDPHSISISADSTDLYLETLNNTVSTSINVSGFDGDYAINWNSSDSSIVTVNSEGVITPQRVGYALISAEIDGYVSNSVKVRVFPKAGSKISISTANEIAGIPASANGEESLE